MPLTAARRAVRESVSGLPREFWWLWTSTLVNRLGAFVATFMALYLTLDRGYSASYAGLVASLHGLGGVISSLGAGVMADRLGRRPTLLVSQASTAVSVALLGFVRDPVAIAAVAFLVGATSNASRPAVQAMMADIVRPEDRVRAFSLNYWAINLGFAVSSMAAGFIAEVSYRAGFLIEAGMTFVCAVVVFLKLPESRPERTAVEKAGESGEAGESDEVGLGAVVRDGRFMGVVGLSFLVALIFQQGAVGLPVAMGEAGFTPADYGLAIAVNGVLIVALQLPVTRFIEHRDPGRLLVISSMLAGYGFGLTAFAGSLGVFVLTVCVWTLAEIINAPTQTGVVVRLSPVHGRGRYQGMYTMSWSVAALVAPLMSGVVIDSWGAEWLWGLCAVVGTSAGVGYWVLMRGMPVVEETARKSVKSVEGPTEAETETVEGPTEAETETETEAEIDAETESEIEAETEAEIEPEADIETKAEIEVEVEARMGSA
ncbi:MDR family MFS transporter [Streptomyces ipomoeae]|uniref:MDR family MFS transporter n=1 Tax=Streptomyces ipomoeae TaxID=103232 RepID=UPI001146CABB|nr:MFS transporter [Streptomyces ipomoeae]MDX2937974.1 MFS transporter [Streptomyces ipomoeae]TQE20798.1 MFS transporter [Streptomyces ipomoeae]